ncbi:MAG TPA: hypothetical protein VF173_07010 [Thermoanaerobaculia bacterium]|nr:hypothetical protein [Thermoanaerobaculia bacterium]
MKHNGNPLRWLAAAALLAALAIPGLRAQMTEHISDQMDGRTAFHMLKSLVGDWTGTAGEEKMPATVTYRISSNGHVVTEVLFPGTEHEMMTLYYLNGTDLQATHYCSIGNRPQFKLDPLKSSIKELVFAFDGGTGFNPGKDSHIHDAKIDFIAKDKLDATWSFYSNGEKHNTKDFHLTRVAAAKSAG